MGQKDGMKAEQWGGGAQKGRMPPPPPTQPLIQAQGLTPTLILLWGGGDERGGDYSCATARVAP